MVESKKIEKPSDNILALNFLNVFVVLEDLNSKTGKGKGVKQITELNEETYCLSSASRIISSYEREDSTHGNSRKIFIKES